MRVGHIAITVSDLTRSEEFYKNTFGFVCVERIVEGEFTISIMKKDRITLELFSSSSFDPLPEYRKELGTDLKTCGVKHFAFAVDDIDEEYKELNQKGVKPVTDIKTLGEKVRYFFIKDPDGVFIEIVEESR